MTQRLDKINKDSNPDKMGRLQKVQGKMGQGSLRIWAVMELDFGVESVYVKRELGLANKWVKGICLGQVEGVLGLLGLMDNGFNWARDWV